MSQSRPPARGAGLTEKRNRSQRQDNWERANGVEQHQQDIVQPSWPIPASMPRPKPRIRKLILRWLPPGARPHCHRALRRKYPGPIDQSPPNAQRGTRESIGKRLAQADRVVKATGAKMVAIKKKRHHRINPNIPIGFGEKSSQAFATHTVPEESVTPDRRSFCFRFGHDFKGTRGTRGSNHATRRSAIKGVINTYMAMVTSTGSLHHGEIAGEHHVVNRFFLPRGVRK